MTVYLARFYREKGAAEYLGVSDGKLRQWRKEGRIRPKVVDGCIVYDRLDLDAFADSLPYEGEGARDEAEEWLEANG